MSSKPRSANPQQPGENNASPEPPRPNFKTPPLEQMVPRGALYLVEQRPLLWFESREAYDFLLYSLLAEFDPGSVTETLLVKNLADTHWELARLQRIKRAALTLQVPPAAWKLLRLTFEKEATLFRSREDIDAMLTGVVNGSATSEQVLRKVQEIGNVSHETLLYEAYTSGLTTLHAIDFAIARIERRLIALLKLLEQRKNTNAALNNAYLEGMMSHTGKNRQSVDEDDEGSDD